MKNNPDLQPIKPASRHYLRVMAFAVVVVLVGTGIGITALSIFGDTPELVQEETHATTTLQFTRSAPVELRIPKLNLQTTFEEPLGLNEDRTIEVPDSYEKVGWYKHGATPGEIGPSVILGHVDSYEGPAVFWPLGQLEKGDEIEIEREDGTIAVFEVTNLERYDQDEFPTELIYGEIDHAGLRLITCTGSFNKGAQRYSHNLVVFGTLKASGEET